jgi:hypothetical protein
MQLCAISDQGCAALARSRRSAPQSRPCASGRTIWQLQLPRFPKRPRCHRCRTCVDSSIRWPIPPWRLRASIPPLRRVTHWNPPSRNAMRRSRDHGSARRSHRDRRRRAAPSRHWRSPAKMRRAIRRRSHRCLRDTIAFRQAPPIPRSRGFVRNPHSRRRATSCNCPYGSRQAKRLRVSKRRNGRGRSRVRSSSGASRWRVTAPASMLRSGPSGSHDCHLPGVPRQVPPSTLHHLLRWRSRKSKQRART